MPDLSRRGDWLVVPPFRPKDSPVAELARALRLAALPHVRADGTPVSTDDPVSLLAALATGRESSTCLLLCVDQFEDLLTQRVPRHDRDLFLRTLRTMLAIKGVHIVVTVRSDYEGQLVLPDDADLSMRQPLSDLWASARFPVRTLSDSDVREIIVGPATERVLTVEPAVIDALARDVSLGAGALPLLSVTLQELYDQFVERTDGCRGGQERVLTWADFEAIGGVVGSLYRRAEALWVELGEGDGEGDRSVLRRVILRLVNFDGFEVAKRRVPLTEFVQTSDKETGRVQRVLELLQSRARLVVYETQSAEGGGTSREFYEPIHDIWLEGWTRLQNWLSEEREAESAARRLSITVHRRLTEDAVKWHHPPASDHPGPLWHNSPNLPVARGQLAEDPLSFNAIETAFLRQSVQRRLVLDRRTKAGVLSAFLIVLAFAAGAFGLFMLAERRAEIADSRRLAAQARDEAGSRLSLAHLLSLEAFRTSDTPEARSSLLTVLQTEPALLSQRFRRYESESQRAGYDVAYSPDGRYLAAAGEDRCIVLYDPATGRAVGRPFLGHQAWIRRIAFRPGGRWLLSGDDGGSLFVWDLAESRGNRLVETFDGAQVWGVAFSADGARMAACGFSSKVLIWDWTGVQPTHREGLDLGVDSAYGLTFSADGNLLAVSCAGGSVRLYSTTTWKPVVSLPHDASGGIVRGVAFHPQDLVVATAGRGGVKLWDARSGKLLPQQLESQTGTSTCVSFSPDGRLLALGTGLSEIQVWDFRSRQLAARFRVFPAVCRALSFSPDSRRLASGGFDGRVAQWDVDTFQSLASYVSTEGESWSCVGFDARGRSLAAGSSRTVGLWAYPIDSTRKWTAVPWDQKWEDDLHGHLAYSPDGSRVATGGWLRVDVRDTRDGAAFTLATGMEKGEVLALAFDGRDRLLMIRNSGVRQLWDIPGSSLIWEQEFSDHTGLRSASINQVDGSFVWSDYARIRRAHGNPHSRKGEGELFASGGGIGPVAFSPDGRMIGWGQDSGGVGWRDARFLDQPVRSATGHLKPVTVVAFNHSETMLASGDADGVILLWDVSTAEMIGSALRIPAGLSGRPDSHSAVSDLAFAPDDRTLAACYSGKACLALWEVNMTQWVQRSRAVTGRNLSAQEWNQFFGADTDYHKTVDDLPIGDGVTYQMLAPNGSAGGWVVPVWSCAIILVWMLYWTLLIRWPDLWDELKRGAWVYVVMLWAMGSLTWGISSGAIIKLGRYALPSIPEKFAVMSALVGLAYLCGHIQRLLNESISESNTDVLAVVIANRLSNTGEAMRAVNSFMTRVIPLFVRLLRLGSLPRGVEKVDAVGTS